MYRDFTSPILLNKTFIQKSDTERVQKVQNDGHLKMFRSKDPSKFSQLPVIWCARFTEIITEVTYMHPYVIFDGESNEGVKINFGPFFGPLAAILCPFFDPLFNSFK